MGAAEWHRALSRPIAAGGGASASNRKEAALRAAGLYTTRGAKGGSRGKSKISPVLHVHGFHPKNKAHSLRLAEHFVQCRYRGQRMGILGILGMLFFCAVFVGAMYSGIFKEHGFLNGQVLFSSIHSIHSIPSRACPHQVHRAKCLASMAAARLPPVRRSGPESSVKWQDRHR